REPAVDLRQHRAGFLSLALLVVETTQAQDGPQLERLRALPAGSINGPPETGFGVGRILRSTGQQKFSLDPMNFRLAEAHRRSHNPSHRLCEQGETLFRIPLLAIRLGQQNLEIGSPVGLARGRSSQALADLSNSLLSLSSCRQRPAPQKRSCC